MGNSIKSFFNSISFKEYLIDSRFISDKISRSKTAENVLCLNTTKLISFDDSDFWYTKYLKIESDMFSTLRRCLREPEHQMTSPVIVEVKVLGISNYAKITMRFIIKDHTVLSSSLPSSVYTCVMKSRNVLTTEVELCSLRYLRGFDINISREQHEEHGVERACIINNTNVMMRNCVELINKFEKINKENLIYLAYSNPYEEEFVKVRVGFFID